jgi:lipopolysaccharide/colanic/teichoic acid biosynthesis glycosyltransferase
VSLLRARPPDAGDPRRDRSQGAKRVVDVVGAATGLIALFPLLLAVAVLVCVTSRGPALFRQERLGRHERPFTLYKFRTMRVGSRDDVHREYVAQLLRNAAGLGGGGLYKLQDDDRVTPIGRWLRRTSIDELPQLINVLRGDMSLVGPRPVLPYEAELFTERHRDRFLVRPGLTGLWQVNGRNRLTMLEALELDVEYAHRHGLLLDLAILARTLPALLRGGTA